MADYIYIVATGVIVEDTATTRDSVITEFRNIFGNDFVVDSETPEGMWIDAETTSRQSVARNNVNIANQINPNLAGGPFLDALWALTGGQRVQATRSTVLATIAGIANTQIPRETRATTTDGDEFRVVNSVSISTTGTTTGVEFESVEFGPIEAATGTLTQITDAILGWETVTNPAPAITGIAQEPDEDSRSRRRRLLGLQGRSVAVAVTSNVLAIPGVRSMAFRENITNTTQTIDGVSLVPHSIWANVDGGADAAIGEALLRTKTAGANWNGTSTVMVTEPASGQQYTVMFQRPTQVALSIRATVRRTSNVADPITATRDSILRYAAGQIPGQDGFFVGIDISPFELSAAVNQDNPAIFVERVEVAAQASLPAYSTDVFTIPITSLATVTEGNIVVVVEG